jgi:hydroxylamine reductase (hybrid-cluster protein)
MMIDAPSALNVLVEKFNIGPVGSVDEDMTALLDRSKA